jgi:hypothetical protein
MSTMDVELTEDQQARRLQSVLTELGPAWTPAELRALLLDLSDGSHQDAAEGSRGKRRGSKAAIAV